MQYKLQFDHLIHLLLYYKVTFIFLNGFGKIKRQIQLPRVYLNINNLRHHSWDYKLCICV